MIFDAQDHTDLCSLFQPGYAGYKPEVSEAPNGDGNVDYTKRYLHVALKYAPPHWAVDYLARAHFYACRIAEAMRVPEALYPKVENGTLRVLQYPPGAGSAEHTDFDLFTVHCYRDRPSDFVRLDPVDPRAEAIDPDVHLGEIGEIAGLGKATRHYVPARPYAQKAIVSFAMPAMDARLTINHSVSEWLAERSARSRAYK
jgi:hypothetical protein